MIIYRKATHLRDTLSRSGAVSSVCRLRGGWVVKIVGGPKWPIVVFDYFNKKSFIFQNTKIFGENLFQWELIILFCYYLTLSKGFFDCFMPNFQGNCEK